MANTLPHRVPKWFGLQPGKDSSWKSFIKLNSMTDGRPIFFLHDGVGDAQQYVTLAQLCSIPFYGVELSEIAPLTSLEALAEYYVLGLRAIQPSGPYLIGGYSFGATLAVEVARKLEAMHEVVTRVLTVDIYMGHPAKLPLNRSREAGLHFLLDIATSSALPLVMAIADDMVNQSLLRELR